jgi:crotonobetainyl-CoA:carnitine CoA-transferase CaiB-like acyl-CoA transferase
MAGVLEGTRVLDFGRYITGPFYAALLADLGAEAICSSTRPPPRSRGE